MAAGVFLSGARYVLGEQEVHHTELPGLEAKAAEYGLAVNAGLWGWGSVFRTERGLDDLAVEAGAKTLRACGIDPGEVDALVFCCTSSPGPPEGHGSFLRGVLTRLGLGDIAVYGVGMGRCVNLLSGLDIATALVTTGRYRRVLVVTTDRVFDEDTRITGYALFSDGGAACLVHAEANGEATDGAYELLGCASAQETASLDWSSEISSDLAKRVNEELLGPRGMRTAEVDALLHANIYLPLLVMKERQAGFGTGQLDTTNTTRVGHCFAADPLINLADREASGRTRPGGFYLLASSVPGSRIGVLARKPGGATHVR
ncbi:hypothetical protein [Amycolatopsis magusensis]|uniref:hypothetical protein n=1 Tax=Amycolatopsis magusensis TaxID=882444 RepID=UPI0024A80CAB|nr:hypothetical protein [Amycolatopsis magusensis]MDI5975738.1 hypothetical protein [Amycolatopsis magusensis]